MFNAKKEKAGSKIEVSYEVVNWADQSQPPRTVTKVFEGSNLRQAHEKAIRDLVKLEMDPASTVVARNTMVKIGDRQIPWQKFEQQISKDQAA